MVMVHYIVISLLSLADRQLHSNIDTALYIFMTIIMGLRLA